MFLIRIIEKNKSKKLTQWDADRYIEITAPEGVEVSHVDFAYEHNPKAIRRETSLSDGIMTAKVPNSLLQRCGKMRVWLVCDDVTVFGDILVVAQKARDEGYVLPDDEDDVYNYTNLEKRIADIEKNGTGGEIAEETDPTVPAWAKQPTKPSYTAEEVGALSKDTKIPTKTSDLENDREFVTETKVDEMLQNLPSGGSGGSEYPKKVFEYEWKDNYDKINVTAIDYENGILTVDSMPSQITDNTSTTVRVFAETKIEGITEPFKCGMMPKEIMATATFYYAKKVGENQIVLYNPTSLVEIKPITSSATVDLTRWNLFVEKSRNKAIEEIVVKNLESNHKYRFFYYFPHSAHYTSGISIRDVNSRVYGSAYNLGYSSNTTKLNDLTGNNSVFGYHVNIYETLSTRSKFGSYSENILVKYPRFMEMEIYKLGNAFIGNSKVGYFAPFKTQDDATIFAFSDARTSIYLQRAFNEIHFGRGNGNYILDGARCEVWDYGEVF